MGDAVAIRGAMPAGEEDAAQSRRGGREVRQDEARAHRGHSGLRRGAASREPGPQSVSPSFHRPDAGRSHRPKRQCGAGLTPASESTSAIARHRGSAPGSARAPVGTHPMTRDRLLNGLWSLADLELLPSEQRRTADEAADKLADAIVCLAVVARSSGKGRLHARPCHRPPAQPRLPDTAPGSRVGQAEAVGRAA